MPNANEMARLEEERRELIALLCSTQYAKEAKERLIAQLREIEKHLGLESIPYNDSRFTTNQP